MFCCGFDRAPPSGLRWSALLLCCAKPVSGAGWVVFFACWCSVRLRDCVWVVRADRVFLLFSLNLLPCLSPIVAVGADHAAAIGASLLCCTLAVAASSLRLIRKTFRPSFTSYTILILTHVGCGMCTCEACSSQFCHTKLLIVSYILFFYMEEKVKDTANHDTLLKPECDCATHIRGPNNEGMGHTKKKTNPSKTW